MFSETSEYYDLVYAGIRDREAELASVLSIIEDRCPSATTVVDVACGTGERAQRLRDARGFRIDGIDLDPGMVAVARKRNPDGRFREADMAAFDLGRRYDVVLSLFSSIGYVGTVERLESAIAAMARHVESGGVVIVEPWFEPGVMEDGYVSHTSAEGDGVIVARTSHTRIQDRISTIRFEYVIATRDGLQRTSEVHELGLFTRDEMAAAFRKADLDPDYDDEGMMGRGLWVASAPGPARSSR